MSNSQYITTHSPKVAFIAFTTAGVLLVAALILGAAAMFAAPVIAATATAGAVTALVGAGVSATIMGGALVAPAIANIVKRPCYRTGIATYGAHSYAVEHNLGGAR